MQISLQSRLYCTPTKINSQKAPSFGTQEVVKPYTMYTDYLYSTYTTMFRDDNDWMDFAEFLDEYFADKDKVNIICQACSDGSEPYTMAIALIETLGQEKAKKFLPIKAFDIDADNIKAAKSGFINLSDDDIAEMERLNIDVSKYFIKTGLKRHIVGDYKAGGTKTYLVKQDLRDSVTFERESMKKTLKNLEDNSNTVFMCRNVLPYLDKGEARQTITKTAEKLKTGSIFLYGSYVNRNFGKLEEDWEFVKNCGFKLEPCRFIKVCDGIPEDIKQVYLSEQEKFWIRIGEMFKSL